MGVRGQAHLREVMAWTGIALLAQTLFASWSVELLMVQLVGYHVLPAIWKVLTFQMSEWMVTACILTKPWAMGLVWGLLPAGIAIQAAYHSVSKPLLTALPLFSSWRCQLSFGALLNHVQRQIQVSLRRLCLSLYMVRPVPFRSS